MHLLLRSNPLRLAVLLWFAGWLVVVMPGHTRGIVKLPGSDAPAPRSACCDPEPNCCDPDPSCCDPAPGDGDDAPTPVDPAKHCAICFLKANLTDPPPVTLYTPFLGELDELAYLVESSDRDALATPQRVRGRAPPA